MLRKTLSKKGIGKTNYFKWRGAESSRLESLTDGVFAFAITLLTGKKINKIKLHLAD